ncbi:MAG: hypothetical protein WCJ30_17210 [Deltaproteobacteria bacterium]
MRDAARADLLVTRLEPREEVPAPVGSAAAESDAPVEGGLAQTDEGVAVEPLPPRRGAGLAAIGDAARSAVMRSDAYRAEAIGVYRALVEMPDARLRGLALEVAAALLDEEGLHARASALRVRLAREGRSP